MADQVLVFSPRPARLLKTIEVSFGRPRRIEDLRMDAHFNELYDGIWSLLKSDIQY
jgi:ABC-type nitrate/sulfonate/bicarbonate transport system ATPase subunit